VLFGVISSSSRVPFHLVGSVVAS